ncbi:unnamed protein product [Moneuplotes crassus]|uniref:Cyclic nucleotide-binding domain-containing protein n=1 Tax=Euplotes crassus TaxID=5936 RepID=A0AAD2DAL9_EUPCR|nr:unnamed protein product [Moneuplotes crassus]
MLRSQDNKELFKIIEILERQEGTRSKSDLEFMQSYFTGLMESILELDNDKGSESAGKSNEELQMNLFKSMKYCYVDKGHSVFQYGDLGSLFYIILKGTVSLSIPTEKLKTLTEQEYFMYLYNNYERLHFEKIEIESRILTKLQEVRESGEKPPENKYDNKIQKEYNIWEMVDVVKYSNGQSFGELALINNKPRAGTAFCEEACHFAIIDRDSYQRILGKMHQKKINKITDFLQNIKIFASLTLQTLQKLTYYMELLPVTYKQKLFKQGEPQKGVFLIKSGEFEITQKLVEKQEGHEHLYIKKAKNNDLSKLKQFRLSIISKYHIIGHQECIDGVNSTCTVQCISIKGSAYFIPKKEFLQRFKLSNSKKALDEEKENKSKLIDLRKKVFKKVKNKLTADYIFKNPKLGETSKKEGFSTKSSSSLEKLIMGNEESLPKPKIPLPRVKLSRLANSISSTVSKDGTSLGKNLDDLIILTNNSRSNTGIDLRREQAGFDNL